MTAEIAILNKSCVALAADSAVTLSTFGEEHKVFNTADKLFHLSADQPIGVMVYSNQNIVGVPIADLLRQFRTETFSSGTVFSTIEAAARELLGFLEAESKLAPASIIEQEHRTAADEFIERIGSRIGDKFQEWIESQEESRPLTPEAANAIYTEVLDEITALVDELDRIPFLDGSQHIPLSAERASKFFELLDRRFPALDPDLRNRTLEIFDQWLDRGLSSLGYTGIVVAGFGADERFPTLFAFEVHDAIRGKLKVKQIEKCDIDREGSRAGVFPFAQREMVERFLFGFDIGLYGHVARYSEDAIKHILNQLKNAIGGDLTTDASFPLGLVDELAAAFVTSMREEVFQPIYSRQRGEFEGLIEFMPKPDLARTAEALINLTSVKRSVSRGFETVGGPVDVALISKSEGFIWVKRKHYFDPTLNPRYQAKHAKEAGGSTA